METVRKSDFRKNRNWFLLLMACLLYMAPRISAQDHFNFKSLSIKDGLSSNLVQIACQDNYGYLWIGTEDGLNRYDGYEIVIYKNIAGDSTSLASNFVWYILEDSQGSLWIASEGGLSKYQREKDAFVNYRYTDSSTQTANRIYYLYEDKQSNLWAGTNEGARRFDPETGKFQTYDVLMTDNTVKRFVNSSTSFIETSRGELLNASISFGIVSFDYNSNIFIQMRLENDFNNKKLTGYMPWKLFEDEDGSILYGSTNGLFRIDRKSNRGYTVNLFTRTEEVSERFQNSVDGIYWDKNGNLWIGTIAHGMYIRYHGGEKFTEIKNIEKNIGYWGFFEDRYGVMWIVSRQGLLKYDAEKEPFALHSIDENSTQESRRFVTSFAGSQIYPERLWLSSSNGIYTYDMSDGRIAKAPFSLESSGLLDDEFSNTICETEDHNLWIGTANRGLFAYDLKKKSVRHYQFQNYKRDVLSSNQVRSLAPDSNGKLWIGTQGGLCFLELNSNRLTRIPSQISRIYDAKIIKLLDSVRVFSRPVSSILGTGDYVDKSIDFALTGEVHVLITSIGEGLPQWNMVDYGWLENAEGRIIWDMKELTETFHAGGTLKNRKKIGFLKLLPGRYRLRYISDDSHSAESWNAQPPADSLHWGIEMYSLSQATYQTFNDILKKDDAEPFMSGGQCQAVHIARNGKIWVGTRDGLSCIDPETMNIINYQNSKTDNNSLSDNVVTDITDDAHGNLWIATVNGLNKLDPVTGQFTVFHEKDGLPTGHLRSLEWDVSGNLWIGSINGLSRIDLNSDKGNMLFINYDVKDGLQGYEFEQGGGYRDRNGILYFTGRSGFNAFLPGKINTSPPDLILKDMLISNRSIVSSSTPAIEGFTLNLSDQIDLNYDQNDLSFEFAAIHFSRPDKNKLFYKMDGVDDEWRPGDRRFASYTNLDPGRYVFHVRGANGDGIWSEKNRSLIIHILPPWWRAWWAYLFYAGLFLGLLVSIRQFELRRKMKNVRLRESQLRAEAAELKAQAIEAQNKVVEAENARKTRELEEARELQLSMLPRSLPQLPHLDIAVYMKTATEVGGDYYDFNVSMDGTLTVVVGDATGHGMKAGTMVTTAKSLFNSYAPNPDILFSFQEITRCIKQMNLGKMSMCMTMVKLHGNKLSLSSAGMPPAYIFRRDGRVIEEHLTKGMPLGTMDKFPYQIKETMLAPGDTILLLSDGLPELQNDKEELFGYTKVRTVFEEVAEQTPEEIVDHLKSKGSEWVDDRIPDDDVTFVVIKMKA